MKIEYDPAKRAETLRHRALDMADVAHVFAGPTKTDEDLRAEYGEKRFVTFGLLAGRMVVIAWTPRGSVRRIISLRKANEREQAGYGPSLRP